MRLALLEVITINAGYLHISPEENPEHLSHFVFVVLELHMPAFYRQLVI